MFNWKYVFICNASISEHTSFLVIELIFVGSEKQKYRGIVRVVMKHQTYLVKHGTHCRHRHIKLSLVVLSIINKTMIKSRYYFVKPNQNISNSNQIVQSVHTSFRGTKSKRYQTIDPVHVLIPKWYTDWIPSFLCYLTLYYAYCAMLPELKCILY